jgi:uncharacterized protein YqeY
MTISDIRGDLKQSMLQKDSEKTSVLRMLLSSISYFAISKNKKVEDLSEEEVNDIILKEIKTRKESIEDFTNNGSIEKAAQEKSELNILMQYAPSMLSEEDIKREINKMLPEMQNVAPGPAMGIVMKSLKGKAEPSVIQKVLQEILKK